ncbi:hypothetical protein [Komagataeibacter sp. FNDCF1]|uniref:hypothetical protein n=1 Tax=Komagataeibacter sp. FNDCF1 TaxID=2878681 RepID=UPI001E62A0E6|nr:hypothetical protein [Komagataeibacter sp. FNDCF1]MCE2564531.1 hypothetical protein [Komagataeibacter sp. FNDCF1]
MDWWRGNGAGSAPRRVFPCRGHLLGHVLGGVGLFALGACVVSHPARAYAECGAGDARIDLSVRQVSFMVGYVWGRGVLHDGVHDYPFTVRGGGMLSLGGAGLSGQGCVHNLARVSDFNGTYWTIGGTATIGHGPVGIVMENARGVDIRFSGRSHGAQLSGQVSRLHFHMQADRVQP